MSSSIFKPLGLCLVLAVLSTIAHADGPADNIPDKVRRIPKLGIEPDEEQRRKLQAGLADLRSRIEKLASVDDDRVRSLLPDVQIFHRAVHDALEYQELFDGRDIDVAFRLLADGKQRAEQLARGEAPWTTARGPVVRGFVSRLDGSVQPYGLVVPDSYSDEGKQRYRLDIWFHGRGETLSELRFLQQRGVQRGLFTPPDTIVLHPYGRYSNAFKFAGEVDVLEGLADVRRRYRVDEERTSVRGFSMGGAACWQFAVHYPDRWFAANPGAGFSETPEFLRFFQKETLSPTWWEQKLWHMYDCTDWARNLAHCPTVAYSGEFDIQKQAADIMAAALQREKISLVHIIGPKTKHRYHPDAKIEVDRRLNLLARAGRRRTPKRVRLVTYTLKYNRMNWVTVDGLGEHWKRATVDASVQDATTLTCETDNVSDVTFAFESGDCPFEAGSRVRLEIDDATLTLAPPSSDRSWRVSLWRGDDRQWRVGQRPAVGLRKRHDLQGPIDDALMGSFLFVRPTGKGRSAKVDEWANNELERAIVHWRRHFRGYARVKKDVDVTDEDIASHHLILWGDPASNSLIKRVSKRLPIAWAEDKIDAGKTRYSSADHALILVHPNPLNPERYVVLNSSFTFRDFAYLNNARQVAKLPDWAVVDVRVAPDSLWPGKVVAADFFNESWQLK